ncbi:MAG TPA: UDP-2,3-diacylglucosamine diphosphatase [Fluviicola sp.]|nr:UDP-2,3-diacylglucosamine diphosphatase [Fluviicola sp.]
MTLPEGKKIYFASDFHLGVPNAESSLEREKRVVRWLSSIENDAHEIFLVGDLFDFWFEYKNAIPKGFVRLQGKIAGLTDRGIPVHFFTGNHDMWMFDYFPKELGVTVNRSNIEREWNGKMFFIGHGDGLGPGDRWYKFMKRCFEARWTRWCFARLHPNFGIGMANFWSRKSRAATGDSDSKFLGEENEWLVIYSKEQLQEKHRDYFIFGHRHLPMDIRLNERSRYINLGEWLHYNTYAVFDGQELRLEKFDN